MAKQTNTLKVKEETHNGQAIKTDFESVEANRSPGHLQIPTPQHSGDLVLKPKVYSKVNLRTSKPENHHPDGPSTVHPATVSLLSQHSVPSFQTTCQKPKTSQGLGDVCMRSGESAENQQFRVRMDKFAAKNDNTFHPCKGRTSTLKSGGINQVERLGTVRPSTLSSTQLKDTANTESQSSLYKQGKRETLPKSSLKNIKRNAARYGSVHRTMAGCVHSQQCMWSGDGMAALRLLLSKNSFSLSGLCPFPLALSISLRLLVSAGNTSAQSGGIASVSCHLFLV